MKKITALCLSLCLSIFLFSCADSSESGNSNESSSTGFSYTDVSTSSSDNKNSSTINSSMDSSVEDTSYVDFTVTFVQDGADDVVKTVIQGDSVDLPEIVAQPPTGYTYAWECTDFSAIQENITVRLKAIANTYTVYFDIGSDSYAQIESVSQTVTYDSELFLYTPTRYGYTFSGWVLKESSAPFTLEKYTVEEDTYLVAKWMVDPDSDRWFTPDI